MGCRGLETPVIPGEPGDSTPAMRSEGLGGMAGDGLSSASGWGAISQQ